MQSIFLKMRILFTISLALSTFILHAQRTIEFRISTVYSNVADMDGFLLGDSDPQWDYEVLDGASSLGSSSREFTSTNCPGTRTLDETFATRSYACNFPTNFTFRWRGFEDDGILGSDANTGLQTVSVSSSGLTATSFTTIATYTAYASGDNCSGGNSVTWQITLQYRVTGNFQTNIAPIEIHASEQLVLAGTPVTLSQVGGTTTNGNAQYVWYTGSCGGTQVGTGPSISPIVNNATTFFVRSVGTCQTTCAQITINASPLDVSLSENYFICENDEIQFHWSTESEINNDYFAIQRMTSPEEWETISQVKGHGTTSTAKQYMYTIPSNVNTIDQYYRLVQVDENGTKTIFDPYFVSCDLHTPLIQNYPNPNTGNWSLYPFDKSVQVISLRDSKGIAVPFELTESGIQLYEPTNGIYLLEVIHSGKKEIHRISIIH